MKHPARKTNGWKLSFLVLVGLLYYVLLPRPSDQDVDQAVSAAFSLEQTSSSFERNLVVDPHILPRKSISCNTLSELGYGQWLKNGEDLQWWESSACFPRYYHNNSAAAVLMNTRVLFIGNLRFSLIAQRLCDQVPKTAYAPSVQYTCENSSLLFLPTPSIASATKEAEKYVKDHMLLEKQALFVGFDVRADMDESVQRGVISNDNLISAAHKYVTKIEKFASRIREAGFTKKVHVVLTPDTCNGSAQENSARKITALIWKTARALRAPGVEIFDLDSLSGGCLDLNPSAKGFNAVHAAISQVFLNVLDQDFTANFSRFRESGSCALVSTAGYLKKFKNGISIDNATYVIRSGTGGTLGFHDSIGSRTDIRIVRHSVFHKNRGSGLAHLQSPEVVIVVHDKLERIIDPLHQHEHKAVILRKDVPYVNFHRWKKEKIPSSNIGACLNVNRDLSSGIWATFFLLYELSMCTDITLYGFLGHLHPEEPYHYFSMGLAGENITTDFVYDSRLNRKGGHSFEAEQQCLLRAADHVDIGNDVMKLKVQ